MVVKGPEGEAGACLVVELTSRSGGEAEEEPGGDGEGEDDKGEHGKDDGGKGALCGARAELEAGKDGDGEVEEHKNAYEIAVEHAAVEGALSKTVAEPAGGCRCTRTAVVAQRGVWGVGKFLERGGRPWRGARAGSTARGPNEGANERVKRTDEHAEHDGAGENKDK